MKENNRDTGILADEFLQMRRRGPGKTEVIVSKPGVKLENLGRLIRIGKQVRSLVNKELGRSSLAKAKRRGVSRRLPVRNIRLEAGVELGLCRELVDGPWNGQPRTIAHDGLGPDNVRVV